MQTPQRLLGMKDHGPGSARVMVQAGQNLTNFLSTYGYLSVDVPVLESTELFLRKSGGELASRMYTFVDPGGHQVSIRPEFTSSIIRAYLEQIDTGSLSYRWQYRGPVVRYEPDLLNSQRQYTQIGAELIGVAGPWADAEVIALASKGLSSLGVKGHSLVIGSLGLIGALLGSFGLSERAKLFLLSNVPLLKDANFGKEDIYQRATQLGFLTSGYQEDMDPYVANQDAKVLLDKLDGSDISVTGNRSVGEIRERYLRKQTQIQDSNSFGDALEMLTIVANIQGAPSEVLNKTRKLISSNAGKEEIDYISQVIDALSNYELDVPITVDFGLVRGIAYYTGVVFEINHPAIFGTPSIVGGGRYDGLIQALGGEDSTSAIGFAWALDRVVEVLLGSNEQNLFKDARDLVLVRAKESSAYGAAVKEAERLRAEGKIVESQISFTSLDESLKYAVDRGIQQVISVGAKGEAEESNVEKQ